MIEFDFRIKAALKEMEKIADKFDLGAVITLHSKTHGEYRFVTPKWAVFKLDVDPKGNFKMHVSHDKKHGDNIRSSYGFLFSSKELCQSHVNLITSAVNRLVEQKALILHETPQKPDLSSVVLDNTPEGHPI